MAFSTDSSASLDDEVKSDMSDCAPQFCLGRQNSMSMKRDSVRAMTPRIRANSIGSNCGRLGSNIGTGTPKARVSHSGLPPAPTFAAPEDSSSAPSTPLSQPNTCSTSRLPPAAVPVLRIPITPKNKIAEVYSEPGGPDSDSDVNQATPREESEMLETASDPGSPDGGDNSGCVDETDICTSSGSDLGLDERGDAGSPASPASPPAATPPHFQGRRDTVPVQGLARPVPRKLDTEGVPASPQHEVVEKHSMFRSPTGAWAPPPLPAPPRPSKTPSPAGSPNADAGSVAQTIVEQRKEIERLKAENSDLAKKLSKAESETGRMVDQLACVMGRMNQQIESERCARSPRSPKMDPGQRCDAAVAEAQLRRNTEELAQVREKVGEAKEEAGRLDERVLQAREELAVLEGKCGEAKRGADDAAARKISLQKEHTAIDAKVREAKDRHGKLEAEVSDFERRAKRERFNTIRQSKEDVNAEQAAAADQIAEKEAELKLTAERLALQLSEAKTRQAWSDTVLDRLGIALPQTWDDGDMPSANLLGTARIRLQHLRAVQMKPGSR